MKKTLICFCLCVLLTTPVFAASSRQDLQDRIDSAKVVLDQIMGAQDSTIPMNILQLGHLRCGGARDGQGSLRLRRPVRPGRGHLPHRPRLERAGLHPHGGRVVRLPDRRPVHRPGAGGGQRSRLAGSAEEQVQDRRRRLGGRRPGGPRRPGCDRLEDERRTAELLAQQGPVCRHRPGRHQREPESRGHRALLRRAAGLSQSCSRATWPCRRGRCRLCATWRTTS